MGMLCKLQALLDRTRVADFLAPLALRLYLFPIFWIAGTTKLASFQSTVDWFGNSEWGLGMPLPGLMATLAVGSEVLGSVMLLFGLGVRWISIPLMVTMLVAAFTVHWQHGWQTIADPKFCLFNCGDAIDAVNRLEKAKEILQQYGNYDWLTGQGSLVILNNGIEMAATYFIILLVLFFYGGGKYVSVDYWLRRQFGPCIEKR